MLAAEELPPVTKHLTAHRAGLFNPHNYPWVGISTFDSWANQKPEILRLICGPPAQNKGSSRHQKDFQSPSFPHHIQCPQLLGISQGPAVRYHIIRLPDKIILSNRQSQTMPCYPRLPTTPSPVHRELGHQGDIVRPGRRWLVGQEGDVHPVYSELLLAELKAGLFLIQLC